MKKWELVNFCELDKYAIKSYCAVHNVDDSLNLGDITKVDETRLDDFTMVCGGSPCQDFSIAGKQKGSVWLCNKCGHIYNPLTVHHTLRQHCPCCYSNDISKTRSSLLVEFLRVIKSKKPNFGVYENVKNIVGKKFRDTTFKMFINELKSYGYNVYWKVLNAKNYGIPQNRERVYVIFIKKELDNGNFKVPKKFDNGIRLRDILENDIDEKYYISRNKTKDFIDNLNTESNNKNAIIEIGNIVKQSKWKNPQKGRVYSVNGISPCLNSCNGGNLQPKIITCAISNYGRVYERELEYAQTITARDYKGFGNQSMSGVIESYKKFLRVRRLTPKEHFRLMGFDDLDYDMASKVVSHSQLYKQAGNSIVVDVLYYIFAELYKAMPYLFEVLKLCSLFSGIGAFEKALDKLYEWDVE